MCTHTTMYSLQYIIYCRKVLLRHSLTHIGTSEKSAFFSKKLTTERRRVEWTFVAKIWVAARMSGTRNGHSKKPFFTGSFFASQQQQKLSYCWQWCWEADQDVISVLSEQTFLRVNQFIQPENWSQYRWQDRFNRLISQVTAHFFKASSSSLTKKSRAVSKVEQTVISPSKWLFVEPLHF